MLIDVPTSKKKEPSCCECAACGIPFAPLPISGRGKKGILLLTECPSEAEHKKGAHGAERTGILSDEAMADFYSAFLNTDIDLERDCWRVDCARCFTHNPQKQLAASEFCRPFIKETIREKKPAVIVACGTAAIKSLFGDKEFTVLSATWEGSVVPHYELGAWVVCCYGPTDIQMQCKHKDGEVFRTEAHTLVKRAILNTIRKIPPLLDKQIPNYQHKAEKRIKFPSHEKAIKMLNCIEDGDLIVFDYECSGLKPDFPQHFIKCVSVYVESIGECFSFLMDSREQKTGSPLVEAWRRVLQNKKIKKVAQNLKHEDRWSRQIWGINTKGYVWDTMLASHFLHCTKNNYTGLKFQAATRFGIFGYDKTASAHFATVVGLSHKGANRITGIDGIPESELLKYCGMDTVLTYWVYVRQKKEIGKWKNEMEHGASHMEGMKFLLESILCFSEMEAHGVFIDTAHLEKMKADCTEKISKYQQAFKQTDLYRKWEKAFPRPVLGSAKQLSHVLYEVMGHTQRKKTDKGEDSTDKEALKSLGIPDLEPLLESKLLEKARDTYVSMLLREVDSKGLIHASFNLHIASSFRSSSNDPNLQNVPIRNKNIGAIIRGAYRSRFGKKGVMVEADLKGAEVSTSACYHQDPTFISYISDAKNDMHRDTMAMILGVEPSLVTKELRHIGKNKFVFPQFYGDWYKPCAESVWAEMQKCKMQDGASVFVQLKESGIITKMPPNGFVPPEPEYAAFREFVEHMKGVERKFWEEMFPVYTEWKHGWWRKYLKQGYVDSFTGFRYGGVIDRKQACNLPIQGDAYHLNQKGVNKLHARMKKNKMESLLVSQVHDSQILDATVDEYPELVRMIVQIMNEEVQRENKWINVPISVEFEISPPGGSWFDKKAFDPVTLSFLS